MSMTTDLFRLATSVRGLFVLLAAYTCAGAFAMMYLENRSLPIKNRGLTPEQVDTNFLYKLYSIRTSKLISREQFAETSRKEMTRWQETRAQLQWDFNTAFLYCFTLHTTIGYGHVCPASTAGKWFSAFYSLLGIPLFLVFIGRLGAVTERAVRDHLTANQLMSQTHQSLPLSIAAVMFAAYCCIGACIFAFTERWSAMDGAYFSIISATSVGLGDFVPGHASLFLVVASVAFLTGGINLCTILLNRLNDALDNALAEPADSESKDK